MIVELDEVSRATPSASSGAGPRKRYWLRTRVLAGRGRVNDLRICGMKSATLGIVTKFCATNAGGKQRRGKLREVRQGPRKRARQKLGRVSLVNL